MLSRGRHRRPSTAQFFEEGRRPGAFGDFLWSLDAEVSRRRSEVVSGTPASVSLPMQHAWDAAVAAWRSSSLQLANGELIAEGMNPISGIRREIDHSEWSRTDLVLDVRNGDLIEGYYGRPTGKHTVRWSAITLQPAKQTPLQKDCTGTKVRGHGYDREGAWAYANKPASEGPVGLEAARRDTKQPLPVRRKIVEDKIKQWFAAGGSTPDMSDIRQNITIPLYAGRRTRGKRKR